MASLLLVLAACAVACVFFAALCYWIVTDCAWPPRRSYWRRP